MTIQLYKVYKNKSINYNFFPSYAIPYKLYSRQIDGSSMYQIWDIEMGEYVYHSEKMFLENMELM